MQEIIKTFLNTQYSPPDGGRILVGVSGGADSLALLHLLRKAGINTTAVCLDHQLRDESADEVRFVREFCDEMGVPFITDKLDTTQFAAAKGIGIEEAARNLRYGSLFSLAEENQCFAVAVAHHADDQAETMLMHFLRGSGRPGLSGMRPVQFDHPWESSLPLIRPLLAADKDDILAYLRHSGISWVEDPGNHESVYFRSKLRNEVLPYLETVSPQLKQGLLKMSEVFSEEDDFLQEITREKAKTVVLDSDKDWILVDESGFCELQTALQRRMILQWAAEIRPQARDFHFGSVELLREFLCMGESGKKIQLSDNLESLKEYNKAYIYSADTVLPLKSWPQMEEKNISPEGKPGQKTFSNGWTLTCQLADNLEAPDDPWQLLIPKRQLTPAVFSQRIPGDRMASAGMDGRIKIKDLMINEKIPSRYREHYPILRVSGEVVWVPGLKKAPIEFTGAADIVILKFSPPEMQ